MFPDYVSRIGRHNSSLDGYFDSLMAWRGKRGIWKIND